MISSKDLQFYIVLKVLLNNIKPNQTCNFTLQTELFGLIFGHKPNLCLNCCKTEFLSKTGCLSSLGKFMTIWSKAKVNSGHFIESPSAS